MRTIDPVKIQRIVEAAAQLFAERHYHEVRMDDIAAKAGVAKGTIYLHFKDKDDLYREVTLDSLKKLTKRIHDAVREVDPPTEKLLRLHVEAIRYFERNVFTLDLMQRVERIRDDEPNDVEIMNVRQSFFNIYRSILEAFPEARSMSDAEIHVAVLALSGMAKEVIQRLPRPWPADLPERLTRFALRGFLHGGQP